MRGGGAVGDGTTGGGAGAGAARCDALAESAVGGAVAGLGSDASMASPVALLRGAREPEAAQKFASRTDVLFTRPSPAAGAGAAVAVASRGTGVVSEFSVD